MPKCSRFISNSPASDHDEAPPFSSVPTPSAPQNEDPEKQQSIKDHIFAQTVVEPPDRTGSEHMISIPRSYQLELAELAKSGNVLVCLDTGSGKTLISVLLLQHMHQQSIAPPSSPALPLRAAPRQPHRVSFFLVNLVPLVHQQSSVIASNSNLAVGKLYGELKDAISSKGSKFPVDSWRAPQWKALLESHQVIVSTAQCFLDALIHGFVKMADLNLLIFDEVHHALKNHPFSRIMTYYRLAPEHQRPKIFGMTASPIFTSTGCFDEASRYLQKTMNARIHTVSRETLHALHEVKQKPEELVIEYEPYLTVLDDESNGAQMSALSKEMIAKFGRCPALDDGRNVAKDAALDLVTGYFEKEVRPKLEYTMRQLGPVGCDLLWHSTLLEYRSHARKWVNIDPENPTLISNDWILNASMRKLAVSPDPPSNGPKSSGSPDHDASAPSTAQFSASGFGLGLAVAHLSTHSELNQGILLRMREQPALPDVLRFDESNSSPKLLRLIETLRCFEPSAAEFCGIIFVERRQTATLLVELIKRAPGLEFLHPEVLLGHENSAANGGAPGMDWHDQVQALNRFRRREPTNLLVATSIAEEGLDIQAANLVIRFDLFNRHISFLQSRGRARADGSRYILMAEARNRDHVQTILNAFNIETNRTDWLQGVAGPAHDAAFWQDEWQQKLRIEVDDDAGSKQNLHEPSTGARLYPEDAPTLISHYAATLHSEYLKDAVLAYRINVDGDARCPTAHHCVLELPSTSAVRSVASGACSSKKQAKRMAAFLACKQLRELGELDEWLMPKNVGKTAAAGPTRADTDQINPHHKAWGESGKPVSVPVKRMDGWARFCASSAAEVGTDEYHATFLPLDSFDSSCQPLLLLSRARLPPTKLLQLLHPISGRLKDLCPASLGTFSTLSTEQVDAATRFTKFVFKLISRKDGKSADGQESYSQLRHDDSGEPAVLVVPVRLASGVTEVHSAADLEFDLPASLDLANFDISAASTGELNGRVLVRHHRCDSPSLYRFEAVRRDLEPNTPITSATPNSDAPMVATYFSQHLQRHDQRHAPHVEGADDEIAAKLECELAGTPLVETTKLATVQNLLSPSENPAQRRTNASATRVLVPFSYKVHPLCAALVASILLLPSVLTRYDQVLLAHACNVDLFNGELDTDSVLEALTSPSARAGFNYERLEFLGDTFLKLVATCHTFTTCLQRTKAELHLANKELLTNARLLTEAKRLGLHRYGVFQSGHFVARRFSAPVVGAIGGELVHNSLPEAEEGEGRAVHEEESRPGAAAAAAKVDLIKGKTLSDMVEALIGAALATGGVDKALMVCRKLRLIPATIRSLSDFNTQLHKLKAQSVAEGWEARVSTAGLQQLEELFAHTYRYPHLGLEAFTHPSLLASMLPSYQRLEFLGDAWLDFHIVTKIFAEHPELSPGEMTALKASLASNAALSALGHRLGLHKYVASNSAVLSSTIKQYAAALDAILQRRAEASTDASEEGEQYWTQLHPDVVMPKAVSDVVEASFASIVVDCAFDVRVSQRVFTRIYAPFYDAFCRWDSVRIRDAKRMIEYLFDALRRGATTTSTASSICIAPAMVEVAVETNVAEVGGALQDHDDKDGRGGGEERVVRAMLTPIEARLRVGATVVGHYTGLPRSVVHLVRAVDVVNEIKVVQARIRDHRALCARNLVATNSINISDDENDPEDDEGSEDAEGADGAGDTGEAGAQWVERLVALLDEYEHLMRELVRALGWKYIFQSQPATLITSDETEQGNSEATERERLRPYSLGELRALVVGDTA